MTSPRTKPTAQAILRELQSLGSPKYKELLMRNYGVREPCFGVKIGDLKKIQKRIKKDYQLALDLYETGNYDAMYLAGLIADDARMTRQDLRRWAAKAYGASLIGATVPWVAAGSPHGYELALDWIDSPKENLAAIGWATLASVVSIKPDHELDLPALERLLERVARTIHQAPDRVRYQMNMFLICVGCYVGALTERAKTVGEQIGPVKADLGPNACEIPYAPDYIRKVEQRGSVGRKRKSAKC